jgi:HTH-type transcriptional regulator/antitoxin HigA
MTIQPIRSKDDHKAVLKRIEAIWGAARGTPEGDELDVLTTLVDVYEAEHFPISLPSAVEAIEFRMEQQGLTRKDLEQWIGSRARVSEVLSGKRALTLPMIRRLHDSLQIPLESLISTVPSKRAATPSRRASRPAKSRKKSPRSPINPGVGIRSRAA